MKKYIVPVTEIHKVNIENLLITSGPIGDTEVDSALGKDYDGEDGDVWE